MKNIQQVLLINSFALLILAFALLQAPSLFLSPHLMGERGPQFVRLVEALGFTLWFLGLLLLDHGPRWLARARVWRVELGLLGGSLLLLLIAFYRQNHVLQSTPGLFVLLGALGLVVLNGMSLLRRIIASDPSETVVAHPWGGLPLRYAPVLQSLFPLAAFVLVVFFFGPIWPFSGRLEAEARFPVEILVLGWVAALWVAWSTTAGQRRDLQDIREALESFLGGQPREEAIHPQSPVAAALLPTVNRFTSTQTGSGSIRDLWLQELAEAAASEERNRLARELHDSIKQQIFSIKMSAAAVDARWDSDRPGARKSLEDVRACAHQAMVEMQALLLQLRPEALANTGLVEALKEQCEALEYRSGAKVRFEVQHLPDESELPPTTQQTLFRIAQEALSNVSRHARAQHVIVGLWQEKSHLHFAIDDDGQGFEVETAKGGFGLQGMRERLEALAGVLTIRSAPGEGTRLLVQVPLVGEESRESSAREDTEPQEASSAPARSEGFFSPAVLLGLCAAWLPGITPNSLYAPEEEKLLSGTLLCVLLSAALISYGWHRWKLRGKDLVGAGDSTPFRLRIFLLLAVAYWWTPLFWWADARQGLVATLGTGALSLGLAGLSTLALFRAIRSAFPQWVQRRRIEQVILLFPWLLPTVASTAILLIAYSWKLFMLAMAGGLMTSGLYLGFVALVWAEHRDRPGAEHEG